MARPALQMAATAATRIGVPFLTADMEPMNFRGRAQRYLQLYQGLGRRHAFLLLAAHGSIWAGIHVAMIAQIARLMEIFSPEPSRCSLAFRLSAFIAAVGELHAEVFLRTFIYYTVPQRSAMADDVRMRRGGALSVMADQRQLYADRVVWEQINGVKNCLDVCLDNLNSDLLRRIFSSPAVRFPFSRHTIYFKDFSCIEERLRNALRAFDIGQAVGWSTVERHALERVSERPSSLSYDTWRMLLPSICRAIVLLVSKKHRGDR